MNSGAARAFLAVGKYSARLPSFRGKNRLFLEAMRLLGLNRTHIHTHARLRQPIDYEAMLDLHSWLQRIAFLSGSYEPEVTSFLVKLFHATGRKGYLLDVGANIGLISLPAAKMLLRDGLTLPSGPAVVCVEAVPSNVSALRRNVEMNAAGARIKVIGQGVGEREKTVDIEVEGELRDGEGTGTANILPEASDYQCVRIPIEISTLDALLDAGEIDPDCPVVKIDTDGYDLFVLRGGSRFLAQARPVIFGEFAAHCLRWHGLGLPDVQTFAREHGYLVWARSSPTGWRFSPTLTSDAFVQDLLLVPRELAEAMHWCLAG